MSESSMFFKNFGKAVGIYILLNFIFILLYPLLNGISIGYFITGILFDDITGFIVCLLIPGGGMYSGDVFSSFSFYLGDAITYWTDRANPVAWDIVGLLWVILPGLLTAILMGKKFWQERPTKSFWTEFTAIFILTILPLIVIFLIEINDVYEFTQNLIPVWLRTHDGGIATNWVPTDYLNIILIGIFNGAFFGGIAALNSTEL